MGHRNIAVNNISIGVKSGEVRGIHRVKFSLKKVQKKFSDYSFLPKILNSVNLAEAQRSFWDLLIYSKSLVKSVQNGPYYIFCIRKILFP